MPSILEKLSTESQFCGGYATMEVGLLVRSRRLAEQLTNHFDALNSGDFSPLSLFQSVW